MQTLNQDHLTEAVIEAMQNTPDARLKEVMTSLIEHLHAFVREVKLTDQEWMAAVQFLTETGKLCDENRQEFILLSDALGVTALKDAINHPYQEGITETTVLGPFYRTGAAELPQMANIAGNIPGEPVVVYGKVSKGNGEPIAGALLDVWQASADGFYDVQLEALDGEMGLRGKLRTDSAGRYIFRSIKPSFYPIPHDGAVGKLLQALNRHPYRPAHIHFIVSADGFQPVVTQIFVAGGAYLESDAVFGVRDSLIVPFVKVDSEDDAQQYGFHAPFYKVEYNFSLNAA